MDHPHDTMVMEGYSFAGYQTFDLQIEGRALSVIAPGRQAWTIGCYSLDGSCLYKGRGRGTETITMTKSARFQHRLVIAVARKGRTIVTRQRMFH